jgi:hypothetical protein
MIFQRAFLLALQSPLTNQNKIYGVSCRSSPTLKIANALMQSFKETNNWTITPVAAAAQPLSNEE